jgi:hypothetical protein
MTYNQALKDAQDAFKAGVHPNFIMSALVAEGITKQRAETIIRWCANYSEKLRHRLDIHT